MATKRIYIFSVLVLIVSGIEASRILMYMATPSISHQIVYRPLSEALAARGHEVIVVTTDPAFTKENIPANLTEIDVHDISYSAIEELIRNHKGNKQDIMQQMIALFETFSNIFDLQLQTPRVQEIMQMDRKYFDVLMLETSNRALMAFAHKFDAPVITLSTLGGVQILYNHFGAPIHPLLYPAVSRQRLYNLSAIEKITEIYKQIELEYIMDWTQTIESRVVKKHFGENIPSFHDLSKRLHMTFLNEHPIWADNHPVPPNLVYVGGIHQTKVEELPKDLKNFLDSSKQGVIYISFGTNVLPSLLPEEKIIAMAKVFSELSYDVLWKYDKEALPGNSNYTNIKLYKWFPQTGLLHHPNVKLFITQAGLQSTDEAINAAIPLLAIPMLGDQWYNAEKYVRHKIGLKLEFPTLTADIFKSSIEKIMHDKSFKNNILRLRTVMRESPIKPLDLAVWWTEYVIKYGGRHLYPPAAHVTWVEYYEIKLVFVVLTILVTLLITIGLILKSVLKFIYRLIFKHGIKLKTN